MRRFTSDEQLTEVRYAVDDAIDLAFMMSVDARVRLVEPGRVVLALSGAPYKSESEQHLNALKAAGAVVRNATQSDLFVLLEQQSRAVGKNGILVASFATHGFTAGDGSRYLVAADSLLRHAETNLAESKIRDLACGPIPAVPSSSSMRTGSGSPPTRAPPAHRSPPPRRRYGR